MGYEFPFFFLSFFGRFVSDFHFLLLKEGHSARQIENQKRSMDWEGCDFRGESTTFFMIFWGGGRRGRSSYYLGGIVPKTAGLIN